MTCLVGHFLIAPPELKDADFVRTVILVVQHSEEQALGLVVNRPSHRTVREAWAKTSRPECYQWVYSGGPVPGPLMALHDDRSLGEFEVLPAVFYTVQRASLEKLIQRPGGAFKIFECHAGWGPGQLEPWLEASHWRILSATAELVFDIGSDLWERVVRLV